MPRPSKVEELTKWRTRIRNAEAYLRQDSRLQRWQEIREYYLNKRPRVGIRLNYLLGIGRAMIPQLYFKSPSISARPSPGRLSDPSALLKAKVIEAVDSEIIECNKLKGQYKLGILDAYRFNIAIFKHGYSSVSTELPETARRDQPEDASIHPAVQEVLAEAGISMGDESEVELDPALKKYSYHSLIRPNFPWALRVPPEDFLVPWGSRNEHEIPWCAFRVRRALDDVKEDRNYKSSVTEKFKANWNFGGPDAQLSLPMGPGSSSYPTQYKQEFAFADEGWIYFYEVWDKREGQLLTFALDQGEDFMRREKHNMPFGLPVTIMRFNDDGEDFWGPSDAETVLPLIKEQNETRTIELDHKKIALLKLFVDKNAISDSERKKIESGEIGPIILVDGNPQQSVFAFTPQLSRDLFAMSDVTRDDIRELIGYSRAALAGEEGKSTRRTATEANIIQQNLMLRGDERRDIMGDFIKDSFGDNINPMLFKFWKAPRFTSVTGYQEPVQYIGSELEDKYTLKIAADSTIPVSRTVSKQEAQILFPLFRGDPKINQEELYRVFLDQMESVSTDRLFLPPEQAQMTQLAMMLAMGGGGGGGGGRNGGQQPSPVTAALQQGRG